MSQVTEYKCPACGGILRFSGAEGRLVCDYCDEKYEVEAMERMLAEKDKAAAEAFQRGGEDSGGWGDGSDGMKVYKCPSCGAELICDGNTAATCCPYCGNQSVVPGQFSGSLKPEFVIPFKTDKQQAKEALQGLYKGKALLPSSFANANHIEEIQGVYVPFWMFDCEAAGDIRYECSKSETKKEGDKEITTIRYYNVLRGGSLKFDKVPVDASTKMPDELMDSVEPYDYQELKPFSMAYMPGFLADKYDEDKEACSKRAVPRCQKTFEDEMVKTVKGYTQTITKDKNIHVDMKAAHYAMLPVWLLATNWNNKKFLFAVNGQSGRIVGELPCDKGKFWGFFAGISAGLILLMMLLNHLVFAKPLEGAAMVVLCIALPVLIGFITVRAMKGQLSSVYTQNARAYKGEGGLHVTMQQDNFIRMETKEKQKS